MNYQSFFRFSCFAGYPVPKKFKNLIEYRFFEYNQVLFWQDPSKTTSLIVNGFVTNGIFFNKYGIQELTNWKKNLFLEIPVNVFVK